MRGNLGGSVRKFASRQRPGVRAICTDWIGKFSPGFGGGSGAAPPLRSTLPTHLPEIETLNAKRVDGGRKRVDGARKRVDGGRKCVAAGRKRVDGVRKRVAGARKRVAGVRKRVDGVRKRVDGVRKRVDGARKPVDGPRKPFPARNGPFPECFRGKRIDEPTNTIQLWNITK